MFVNETGIIGTILQTGTESITGSIFISLLIIMIILFSLCIFFNIRLEFSIIIFLPLLISYASYYSEFVPILGAGLIYLTIILSKNFFFK